MVAIIGKSYELAEFRLETATRRLLREDAPVHLAHRPLEVLLYLIENRGRMVTRNELLEKFWDGREAYDEALTKCVGAIRKALGEQPDHPRFIETRWAEGYRFIGPVSDLRSLDCGLRIADGDALAAAKNPPAARWPARKFAILALCVVFVLGLGAFLYVRFPRPSAAPAPKASLAVLPLKNLTPNTQNEHFADGLTESLIGSLAKVEGLKVISRNSVFMFKDKDADPREVGQRLGVAAVLEGSVRENGDKIRVEVRLVNAADGQVLWSGGNYERALSDVFAVQDDIARSVATQLRLKLAPAGAEHPAKQQTNNVAAYQAYLKGRYFWRLKDRENLSKSRKFFEEAIRLDPNYALAYAGVADYYFSGIWYADLPRPESIANGKAAVLKVLELAPGLPEAHDGRARAAEMEWEWAAALREKEKALELNPNNAPVWQGYAFLLLNDLRREDALAAIRRAQELDPLSANIGTDVGVILTNNQRYDEAVAAFRKTLEIDPRYADAYLHLGDAYERQGQDAEAFAAYLEAQRHDGAGPERLNAYRAAFAQAGVKGYWRKYQAELLAGKNPQSAYWIAAIYAYLGEKEPAFDWLEKAYATHEPLLGNLKIDRRFDALRDDPRFVDLLRRVGLGPGS